MSGYRRRRAGVGRLGCGCTYDERAWLSQCDAHRAEHAELHARALADLRRGEAARGEVDFEAARNRRA